MTTPEHTLVGVHFAIASGILNRYGWRAVVLAGLVSNIPDLDGLPFLVDTDTFVAIHRIWGHNVTAILFSSVLVTLAQYRWDFLGAMTNRICRVCMATTSTPISLPSYEKPLPPLAVLAITVICQLIHLPCDMVVSGGYRMADWPVKPWWPFFKTGYVFPMIPWGDPGVSVVVMIGLIALARDMRHSRMISAGTLAMLVVYLVTRRVLSAG